MGVVYIEPDDEEYPAILQERLGDASPRCLSVLGDMAAIRNRLLGLVCSVQCPGSIVIKTFDAIRELRDASVVVAGGFHSPMEKECLEFLLRGDEPVVVCPAKGLARARLPASWRPAVNAGRLLILSPFPDNMRRITTAQAQARNEFVAALTSVVLIPHASRGGKAEAVARSVLKRSQPLFTFDDDENMDLLQLGARPYKIGEIKSFLKAACAAEHNRLVTATP